MGRMAAASSLPGRSTREALLAAARDAAIAGDWQRIRMHDVAASAGVSRQTLYNEFGSKDALAQALALRETARFLDGIDAAVDAAAARRPADAVRAAVTYTFEAVAGDPLVKAMLLDDGGLLPLITTRGEPVLSAARARMVDALLERFPHLPPSDVEAVSETVTRLALSYLMLPDGGTHGSPAATAGRIAHLVDRLLSDAPLPARPEEPR